MEPNKYTVIIKSALDSVTLVNPMSIDGTEHFDDFRAAHRIASILHSNRHPCGRVFTELPGSVQCVVIMHEDEQVHQFGSI